MTSFKEALRTKDFVVTAELPLTPESTAESIIADADPLKHCVDGYLLTDNQYGQPHMAPSYAACVLKQNGYPPLLQISSRNRNRIALMGELLGARAMGLDTVVLVRGAILPEGYKPRPAAVMDTDAKDLIATARLISEDHKLGPNSNTLIGTSATVHDPPPDAKPEELLAKADAGTRLVITQVCLNADILRRYMAFLVGQKMVQRFSVIVSIAIVTSRKTAQWLRDNRRGTILSEELIEHLPDTGDDEAFAIDSASRLLREIKAIPGVAGANFACTGDMDMIADVIAKSGAI